MVSYSPKPASTGRPGSNPPYDPFSFLASTASSSAPASRSLTPSNPRSTTVPATQNSSDAFSSLLGPSFSSSNNQESLSLAARREAAQKEQEAKAARDREARQNESAAWSGLDFLGQGSSNSVTNNARAKDSNANFDDDWLFDKVKPEASLKSNPTSSSVATHVVDDWGLSDFPNQPQNPDQLQSRPDIREQGSLFDALGDEDLIPDAFGRSTSAPAAEDNGEPEDDILGALSKPIASKPASPPEPAPPPPAREQVARGQTSSPPPHIIGQIVEMGFTPQQARLALASTDTGLDVQQALETLLSNGVGTEPEPGLISDRPRRGLAEFQDEDDDWEGRRDTPRTRPSIHRQTSSSTVPNRTQSLISQERADKLLAQASEIGFSVFNRANALWKDGKEKVQKVYEERAAKGRPISDGRPRWMADIRADAGEREHGGETSSRGSFRDDGDVAEQLPPLESQQKAAKPDRTSAAFGPHVSTSRAANLFDDEPAVYVSPARRRPAPSRSTSQTTSSPAPASTSSPIREAQPSPPLRTRQAVSATASTIASSNAHKEKGTELYKLGQYANAEQAYSVAIDILPANHLLLVPLYNNRALSRIRIGEHATAVEDCTAVLSIIGSDYHPAREAKVTREEEGASVDLADAFLKALRRRAEAYEGREKWELALRDWEAIVACEWAARMRNDAFAGASRCRKILSPEKDTSRHATPIPRPVARTAVSKNEQDFEAVKKLRQAHQALEQEEQTKANLKDSVDDRLTAWKAGKETNVRALVASLDTVLWPELGWQKVGLHELVTPNQVKVRYMKAIAKVHPDKINSGNTTVEQRMIANGVFAALNDAWIAFKQ